MTAISTAKARTRIGALPPVTPISLPIKGSTKIVAGALVDRDAAGYAVNAATNTTGKPVGVAQETYDNSSGADGAISGNFLAGCWVFENSSSGDLITIAELGTDCYVVDNNTVAKTSNSNARHVAGKVYSVEADGRVGVVIDPVG